MVCVFVVVVVVVVMGVCGCGCGGGVVVVVVVMVGMCLRIQLYWLNRESSICLEFERSLLKLNLLAFASELHPQTHDSDFSIILKGAQA